MAELPKTPKPGTDGASSVPSAAGFLAAILESSDDAIIAESLDGVISTWNAGAAHLFGYTAEEVVGRLITVLAAPGHESDSQALLERVRRGERIDRYQTARRTKDGHLINVNVSVCPVRDEHGTVVAASKIARQTTEQEGEGFLRALMEHVPEGITIADAPDVRIRMVSKFGQEIVGKPTKAFADISVEEQPLRWGIYHSDGVTLATPEELPLTRATVHGEYVKDEEWAIIRGDGTKVPVLCNAGPIRDGSGQITGGVIVWRDISDRKRAEEAIQRSEQRFRALVTASSDVIYRMSPDWDKMWHLDGGEFIANTHGPSRTWLDKYIHPDDQPEVLAAINEAIRTKSTLELEHRVLRVDGSLGWTFSRAIPILDESGEIIEWFGAASDVTARKQAEQRRTDDEVRIRSVLDHVLDGIIAIDENGLIEAFNPAAEKLFGYKAEEVIGQNVKVLMPEPFHGEHDGYLGNYRRTGQAKVIGIGREAEGRRKDGSRFPMDLAVSEFWLGNRRYFTGIVRDITEPKRAEEAVRESERRLAQELADMTRLHQVSTRLVQSGDASALLLDIVDAAVAVTDADMGTIQVRDLECGRLRIMASGGFDAPFLDSFNAVHDGQAACGTAMRIGERVVIEDVSTSPLLIGTPALEVLLAAGVRAVQSTPLVSRSGSIVGILSTHYRDSRLPTERDFRVLDMLARQAADFLERHHAEQALKVSEELTHKLVEQCPFGIYIVDAEFRIVTMNRGSQDGAFVNVRPVIGRPFDEAMRVLWPEPVAADIIRAFRHTLDSGEPYRSKDFVNQRADKDQVEGYEWELHRVTLPDGHSAVACYYYDSTKLRAAEQALREADRHKNEFLATLAHELRNPLAAIRNAAALLRLKSPAEPQLDWSRDVIDRQTTQLTRLIDDLLDISRISRGKAELKKEPLDVRDVIRRAAVGVQPLIEAKKHDLRLSLTESPLPANADSARLEQMLGNLLSNAAKYTDKGGSITLSADCDEDDIVIHVRDTGVGISADQLPYIFGLFTQVGSSLDRSQGGLGIGLALVKSLAEMHGGSVTAASEGPGRGSEFTLRLPALVGRFKPHVEVCLPEGGAETIPCKLSPRRILIVDDNVDTARSMAWLLKAEGYTVATAHDGPKALDLAREFQPEVVLLDIGLPGMDGYQVARAIRGDDALKLVTIIAVSGYGQEQDRIRSREAGFDHHLLKPVDFDRLRTVLSEPIRETEQIATESPEAR